MEFFYLYLVSAMVAIVLVYACMRWIDFGFTKKEDKRRYKMAKSCIRCYNDGQKMMAKSLIKELNNNLYDMYKKMGDL